MKMKNRVIKYLDESFQKTVWVQAVEVYHDDPTCFLEGQRIYFFTKESDEWKWIARTEWSL
ncbi:hypothetical protein ACFSTH_17655 [Paenibacillus yanchengensis]